MSRSAELNSYAVSNTILSQFEDITAAFDDALRLSAGTESNRAEAKAAGMAGTRQFSTCAGPLGCGWRVGGGALVRSVADGRGLLGSRGVRGLVTASGARKMLRTRPVVGGPLAMRAGMAAVVGFAAFLGGA